ncbi:hypothetical protein [Nonomuraea gerenzanensis]|uniref:Uncharacterized protein n=1 Tax=Nonomuraea gerenzanensis TaxID=93944 RepID=A0A1M4DVL9_9ACTN|nr:hypothetical protein [Nonomuraea gerenzanensis]UBU12951.1 hypothetical protein LCN96_53370 [Nonomuraea gerenzanensis]SBO90590.1 hypothetical protein BN4615_P104 [Nonomuraea gerenzanensis]
MKTTESTTRTITIELTEAEAQQLRGVLTWFPTNTRENYTGPAEDFFSDLDNALYARSVKLPPRAEYVTDSL